MNTHPGNEGFDPRNRTPPADGQANAAQAGRTRTPPPLPARGRIRDVFAPLYPPGIERMPVAWETVSIPGPPPSPPLAPPWQSAIVQQIPIPGNDEVLAFVDKSAPHALYDVMCCELGPGQRTTGAALSATAQAVLWRTALTFVELTSEPAVRRAFGLEGGRMLIAFDSASGPRDRASSQGEAPLQMHYIHWRADELAGLRDATPLGRIRSARVRRRLVDPVGFLGGAILADVLRNAEGELPFRVIAPGADREPPAPGCHLRIDGWRSLADPAFARGMVRLHHIIEQTHASILHAFTGRDDPPAPWQRHALLPTDEIRTRLAQLDFLSSPARTGLAHLAGVLQDIPAWAMRGLRRHPALQAHHLSLGGPCYTASLQSSLTNHGPAGLLGVADVRLTIQPRLLSDLGAADVMSLGDVPYVKLRRGQGTFSEEMWRRRCAFLRTFLTTNTRALSTLDPRLAAPIATFTGSGWNTAATS